MTWTIAGGLRMTIEGVIEVRLIRDVAIPETMNHRGIRETGTTTAGEMSDADIMVITILEILEILEIPDPRREFYDDPYTRSSRPSSRSSYNDRERDFYGRRDPYYGYNGYNTYDFGTNYNNNYYAYLENLRRTNPTAYMEWYNKYYGNQQHNISSVVRVPSYPEDRASVHSGRSSCDDRTNSGKHTIGDISLLEDSRIVSRLTPTKFSTSHVQGSFSIGSLVQVHASYPADGERAKVDIVQVDSLLMHDPITREIRAYPGPLVKGVTHKKTIIEYCEAKIKKAAVNDELIDHASYILLYQLMIMLIQQNGNVVGVDIATLLLKNKEIYPYDAHKTNHKPIRRESTISQRSGGAGREGSVHEEVAQEIEEVKPIKTVEQITNEFRNTLLCGLVQEALEYAMTEGLWGHALFLASKLDKRTHASVMTRFANSLPVQDPLQTLYQLHSGRVPASVTCVADSKWDDWRPHLAMIISNTSANPEINRRAISTLGDTLTARGDIHGAHFCYILAQIDFEIYGTPGVKLVLIGSNHHKSYVEFATLEAVMLTEIYEYARNLSEPGFTIVGLQTFKFEIAQKMLDHGLIEKALLYLEQIAINIVQEPSKYKASFIQNVYTLSERIKFHDPVFKDCIEDVATLAWLNNLSDIVGRCQTGEIVQESNFSARTDAPSVMPDHEQRDTLQQWNYQQDYSNAPVSMMEVPTVDTNQDTWQPMSLPNTLQESYVTEQNIQYGQNVDGNQYHHHQQQQQQQQQSQSQQEQPQEYWKQTYNQNYSRDYNSDWQQPSNQMQYHGEQTDVDSAPAPGWNYESDKEEKPPTPEVSTFTTAPSNYNNINDNKILMDASSYANTLNTIRRRKIRAKNQLISNDFRSSTEDDSRPNDTTIFHTEKPRRLVKYPKVTTPFPNIMDAKKLPTVSKQKKIDPKYLKPPSAQPAVFLKCKPKMKPVSSEETDEEPKEDDEEGEIGEDDDDDDDGDEEEQDENVKNVLNNYKNPTDLDIQFSKMKLESFDLTTTTSSSSSFEVDKNFGRLKNRGQTLEQYCNFEEKKIVRVAPHIRRKDVICDTVDAWSYNESNSANSGYKPIIFGGTFNIDVPAANYVDNRLDNQVNKTRVLPGKRISKTFDIDAPVIYDE
ncbi:hypothetical protein G9C98_007538 [Cotesia typhae]|uniref:Sec16 Sec23-binding domain-containing protein n=1 Tax=Cotesia typhae TaxID=2053667 RepID=A0A8J5QVL4_9HYME|nr:hypothetical protein G9C98_007538 [Cotesia typhae]